MTYYGKGESFDPSEDGYCQTCRKWVYGYICPHCEGELETTPNAPQSSEVDHG